MARNRIMKYARLRADLETLAQFGRDPGGGHTRQAYTIADIEARRWLAQQMVNAGLEVQLDPAANVIGRLPATVEKGEAAALLIGSHIDTVPNGGALDGALGVLAGLEVVRRLQDESAIRIRPLDIIAFEDEEGRFGAFTGSRVMMGELDPSQLAQMRDAGGVALGAALESVGLSIDEFPKALRSIERIAGYLELHIEQGPILERKGLGVGIVNAIAGQVRFSVRFDGRPDHAGSTPMSDRKDAFAAAALFATKLRQTVIDQGRDGAVMTIGIVKVEPGVGNIVPSHARLGLEIRDTDKARLGTLAAATEQEAETAAKAHNLIVRCRKLYQVDPVQMHPRLCEELKRSAQMLGLNFLVMPSPAGHDAQVVGRHAPSAMIFVPSKGGRSHCPEEATEWSDIEQGVDLLYEATVRLLRDSQSLATTESGN
jgi:N-carbamoyl-L-amino-acid hydrolase